MRCTLFATAALVTLAALGCQNSPQNSVWNNPYAAFGPATVPPASPQAPPTGYYQPPAATPTLSGSTLSSAAAVSTLPPIVTAPTGSTKPALGGTIRSEITATPAAQSAPASSSFSTSSSSASEEPIRIVEASPTATAKSASVPKPTFSTTLSDAKAPAVVAANPKPAATTPAPLKTIPAPGVLFNPSSPATVSPGNSSPAANPALDRTRGYGTPPAPNRPTSPAAPSNRLMSIPGIRRDAAVAPATFNESAGEGAGAWKVRSL